MRLIDFICRKGAVFTLLVLLLSACHLNDARGPISAYRLQQDYPPFYAVPVAEDSAQSLTAAMAKHGDLSFKVFFGTWCSDSQRDVPIFLSLVKHAAPLTLELIALDRTKIDDEKQTEFFQVKRIPSIIVLQHGKEIGRITEAPKVSVAADLAEIIAQAE